MARHQIGDSLYELVKDYDGQMPDRVLMYPVIKVTAKLVFVHGAHHWDADRTYLFGRSDLERDGSAWNREHRLRLYARPQNDWPLLVVSVTKPEPPAITGSPG